MLTGIITNYLTQHRRLVVPQLGTFVVKVPEGGVVFSELLKRDDGILRGLLVQQGGMNDLEVPVRSTASCLKCVMPSSMRGPMQSRASVV